MNHKIFYRTAVILAVILIILAGYFYTQTDHGVAFCARHGKLGDRFIRAPEILQPCSLYGVPFNNQLVGFEGRHDRSE